MTAIVIEGMDSGASGVDDVDDALSGWRLLLPAMMADGADDGWGWDGSNE